MADDFILYGPDGQELPKLKKTPFPWLPLIVAPVLAISVIGNHIYHEHIKNKPTSEITSPITITSSSTGLIYITQSSLDVPDLGSPADAPPTRVLTSKAVYRICYTTMARLKEDDALAETDLEGHRIWLAQDASVEFRRESLYHELMHVAFSNAGEYARRTYAQYGKDEQFINPTAPEMLDILRRNPKMADWLEHR